MSNLTETNLGAAVKETVNEWLQTEDLVRAAQALSEPHVLGAWLASKVSEKLEQAGVTSSGNEFIDSKAFRHLENVFDVSDLPDTPQSFFPIPVVRETIAARGAVLAAQAFLEFETISYGSENEGELFVNLVTLPGDGILAVTSTAKMSGHTDAVTFPFAGQTDPNFSRISPSPDIVALAAFRNQSEVPTMVMPLDDILDKLGQHDIEILMERQFIMRSQKTFIQGTKRILGKEHTLTDAAILHAASNGEMWARFSHKSVGTVEDIGPAAEAVARFKEACANTRTPLPLKPGDILLVNNRRALHGRGEVGTDIGGQSRWIMRSYGLRSSAIKPEHRTTKPYILYP